MTDQPPSPDDRRLEPIDEEQRGAAYERAVEEGQAEPADDEPDGPGVRDRGMPPDDAA